MKSSPASTIGKSKRLTKTTSEVSSLHTPFLKISILANFSIRQNNSLKPVIRLSDTQIMINPIALGVRKYIRNWEKENNKKLNRKGSSIILTVNGELNNLFIQGLND